MSDVAFASELIKDVVPAKGGATISARILATARNLGWRYNRARDVWYEQARRIDAREMDQLRAAREARKLREASDEYKELRARIARIEAALIAQDENFYRPHVDALEQSLRGFGGVDRAGTEGRDR
jgi:hypothetical protein